MTPEQEAAFRRMSEAADVFFAEMAKRVHAFLELGSIALDPATTVPRYDIHPDGRATRNDEGGGWVEYVMHRRFEQMAHDDGYITGYGAAMDDGWGEPGHIANAVADERMRIIQAIRNYYAVAPKAAEPLLEFIKKELDG